MWDVKHHIFERLNWISTKIMFAFRHQFLFKGIQQNMHHCLIWILEALKLVTSRASTVEKLIKGVGDDDYYDMIALCTES